MQKMKQAKAFLLPDDHRQIKSLLALKGITFSEWVRQKVQEEISK